MGTSKRGGGGFVPPSLDSWRKSKLEKEPCQILISEVKCILKCFHIPTTVTLPVKILLNGIN
jgi:hypothetical protein